MNPYSPPNHNNAQSESSKPLRWWQRRRVGKLPVRFLIAIMFAIAGAFVGGCIGIPVGMMYVEIAQVSNFEGRSGFAVIAISNAGSLIFAFIFGLYGLLVWTTSPTPRENSKN